MLLSVVAIITYFILSWSIPWPSISAGTSISFSYLFDIFYVALLHIVFKRKLAFSFKGSREKFVPIIGSAIFSIICLVTIKEQSLMTPFKYVDQIAWQLLVFAPVVEEIVFRGAFYALLARTKLKLGWQALINSALFSFSHIIGLKYLPEVFTSFIYFQILYTFVLGWICFKARYKTHGIWSPILIHFVFNLIFFIAVSYFGI